MAKERWFTGFEDGSAIDCNSHNSSDIFFDSQRARTGDFIFRSFCPVANNIYIKRTLLNSYTCTNDGDKVIARMQYAFKIVALPTVQINLGFFSSGTTVAPAQDARIYLTAAGLIGIEVSASNGSATVGYTSTALQLEKWYVLRGHYEYMRNNSGNDPSSGYVNVYDGNSMDDENPFLVGTATSTRNSSSISTFTMSGNAHLSGTPNSAKIIEYDDWWYSIADGTDANLTTNTDLEWPGGSRVMPVPVTGQSAEEWTGEYKLIIDTPMGAAVANEQTTTVASATTTFTHDTAAQLGLIPLGQLATTGTEEEQEDSPSFTGAVYPEGLVSGSAGHVLFLLAADATLPVPQVTSVVQQAGAGTISGGVWARAFTVRMNGSGSNRTYQVGPFSTAQYLSAADYPSFAAQLDVQFNESTPADSITGTDSYVRYGLGLMVTNAYNNAGILDPTSATGGTPTAQTNTTNLLNLGGQLQTGPYGQFVALSSYLMPQGTGVPYAFTNPLNRPTKLRFLISSPLQGTSSFGGVGTPLPSTNIFGYIFAPPASLLTPALAAKPAIGAVKVYAQFQRSSGTGNDDILINGVATSVAVNTTYAGGVNGQYAINWTEMTPAEFDAMVFGARSSASLAVTLRLGHVMGEVLTAGPGVRRSSGDGQFGQLCGSYTGNGTFQKITTGFRPSAIMVKKLAVTASPGSFKAWWMGGTISFTINGSRNTGAIMLIEDDGFWVGPDASVNTSANTYAYVAMRDGQQDTVNDAYMATGIFTKVSSSDPAYLSTISIPVPVPFSGEWTPDVVMVFSAGGLYIKTPEMAASESNYLAAVGLITDGITTLTDRQFTIGAHATIQANGWYPWLAFKFDAGGLLATVFQTGSFLGTGVAQVIPTNFMGEMIVLDHPASGYAGRWRSNTANITTGSQPWIGGAVTSVDITAIAALSFTAGTGASVVAQISYWWAWKIDGDIGNTGNSGLPPPGEDDDGAIIIDTDPVATEPDSTEFAMESDADRMMRLANLCSRVLHRLGDSDETIWTESEIDTYIQQAAFMMVTMTKFIWDQIYVENIPAGFHCNCEDEVALTDNEFYYGVAACTFEDELEYGEAAGLWIADEVTFGNHTSPAELPYLVAINANIQAPPTAELPRSLVHIERSAWDHMTMSALSTRSLIDTDSQFQLTRGETFGWTWRMDGARTFRKVQPPSSIAQLMITDGSFGIARNVDEASGQDSTGTWGIPRRIPGWHPMGWTVGFGMPRRFYYDTLNVKVEHWRKINGSEGVECRMSNLVNGAIPRLAGEIPRHYFMYIADYCQWRALLRNGPGQNYKLAELYKGRWERNLGRLASRISRKDNTRISRLGGSGPSPGGGPPRPRLPWQYGSRVR